LGENRSPEASELNAVAVFTVLDQPGERGSNYLPLNNAATNAAIIMI
jgi:hypothetical protein